jgi:prepilin-type N-terminal cleavage/methylation domain-containing protein
LRSARARAFSLVELLVVIAIVGLLASLLFPVLNKTRGSSQATVCRHNLKQLGLACAIYLGDHQQCLPPALRHNPWVLSFRPSGLESKILVCPSDRSVSSRSAASVVSETNLLREARSFIMNGFTDWIKTVAGYVFPLRRRLPGIRIPLRESDSDVVLNLQPLVDMCFEDGGYALLDVSRNPEPPLPTADAQWLDECLKRVGLRSSI